MRQPRDQLLAGKGAKKKKEGTIWISSCCTSCLSPPSPQPSGANPAPPSCNPATWIFPRTPAYSPKEDKANGLTAGSPRKFQPPEFPSNPNCGDLHKLLSEISPRMRSSFQGGKGPRYLGLPKLLQSTPSPFPSTPCSSAFKSCPPP